jgi:hypothetical protein
MYGFYKSTSNPVGLSGTVGGAITTYRLSGYLGELFAPVTAPPEGISGAFQYRKLHVKNEFSTTSTYTRVWIDQADHVDQISLAIENVSESSSTSPLTAPTGLSVWYSPTNYVDGLEIGTLTANAATGLWLRQELSGVLEEDPFATFRVCVGGIIA